MKRDYAKEYKDYHGKPATRKGVVRAVETSLVSRPIKGTA